MAARSCREIAGREEELGGQEIRKNELFLTLRRLEGCTSVPMSVFTFRGPGIIQGAAA